MIDSGKGHRLPDFIIAGAPRCATTWLAELAELHPEIAMVRPLKPEPKFFLIDELYARGTQYYSETWFAGLPDGCRLGEKSTNYLEGNHTALRIWETIPEVKLVFVLRNPVDRAYSNYLWSKKNGLEIENFATALALEEEREQKLPPNLRYTRPFSYYSRGLYASLLTPYLEFFPKDQIQILRYEDIAIEPQKFVADFYDFLDVERRTCDVVALGKINSAIEQSSPKLSQEIRGDLTRRYEESNRQLATLIGWSFRLSEI